jgi:formylglycine-generating enzyme required for sulfatase activity
MLDPRQRILIAACVLALLMAGRTMAQPASPTGAGASSRDDVGRGHLEFIMVPAGTFQMGSPETEWGSRNDETRHQVTISRPFYLARYEITQGQWAAITGNNPSFL